MKVLERRLSALEEFAPATLSPALKAWLGDELTDAEREQLDREVIAAEEPSL